MQKFVRNDFDYQIITKVRTKRRGLERTKYFCDHIHEDYCRTVEIYVGLVGTSN